MEFITKAKFIIYTTLQNNLDPFFIYEYLGSSLNIHNYITTNFLNWYDIIRKIL